jgi:hypothetical protein
MKPFHEFPPDIPDMGAAVYGDPNGEICGIIDKWHPKREKSPLTGPI